METNRQISIGNFVGNDTTDTRAFDTANGFEEWFRQTGAWAGRHTGRPKDRQTRRRAVLWMDGRAGDEEAMHGFTRIERLKRAPADRDRDRYHDMI